MTGFRKLWDRIAKLAELPADVTPHVLRHSYASLAADLGYSEPTIAALVGHKGYTVTSRYVHSADAVTAGGCGRRRSAHRRTDGRPSGRRRGAVGSRARCVAQAPARQSGGITALAPTQTNRDETTRSGTATKISVLQHGCTGEVVTAPWIGTKARWRCQQMKEFDYADPHSQTTRMRCCAAGKPQRPSLLWAFPPPRRPSLPRLPAAAGRPTACMAGFPCIAGAMRGTGRRAGSRRRATARRKVT